MEFQGQFQPTFAVFVREKAAKLSLDVTIKWRSTSATISTKGPIAAIGALEMAACIAPEDCYVTDWHVVEYSGIRVKSCRKGKQSPKPHWKVSS